MPLRAHDFVNAVRVRLPGLVVAASLALAASWMAGGMGDPLARNPVLVAMLFGLLIGSFFECPEILKPGLNFTLRPLLRLGVILLGFRITTMLLADLGLVPISIAAAELVITLVIVGVIAKRIFKLDSHLALLIAVGAAVCGAAAILSVAAMKRERRGQHTGVAIAVITVSGTVALLLYPVAFIAGWMPGLDERGFGIMVGASIFELAQVYGASFAVSEGALNTATLVKLSKVVMLVPLLLLLGILRRHYGGGKARDRIPIPWFVVGFIAVLLFNSSFTLHPQVRRLILEGDQFLFLMVTVALGIMTPLSSLREAGGAWRLAGVGAFALVVSAASAYALVLATSAGSTNGAGANHTAASTEVDLSATTPGGRIFVSVGCAKCHVPSLQGNTTQVLLYSDLLLHDMGPGLDDKIVQGDATGADWRTTPLIGLSLRQRYLHDGRAATLRDAILEHGGEGEIVRRRFFELDEQDQQAVYRFLMML